MLKLAYGRVSTDKADGRVQTLDQQTDKFQTYGVLPENVYTEKISGSINLESGKAWLALKQRAIETTEPVEVVLVDWSRLSREFYDFIAVVRRLSKAGAVFTVLGDPRYQQYSPKDSQDGLMLAIEAFGAQFYREKISVATKAKLDFLRTQGVVLGRPTKITEKDMVTIKKLKADGLGAQRIADHLTRSRVGVVAKTTYGDELDRLRAMKHARVSKSLIVPLLRELTNS